MAHVVLVNVKWNVDWLLAGGWDDGRISIGLLGIGWESSCLRLGDGKNGEEP